MKNFEVIPVTDKCRPNFKSIMEDFISRGFFYSNSVNQESKIKGILGFFLKEIN